MIDTQHLKDTLHNNVIGVEFTKKDGTERYMKCTLLSSYLPKEVEGKRTGKKPNEEVLNVWDVEKKDRVPLGLIQSLAILLFHKKSFDIPMFL